MAHGKPVLPNWDLLISMGIDPQTGKMKDSGFGNQKPGIKKFLRIIDEQDAVNRYVWYNLPGNITSQELERMLYYKGQLAFFYMKDLDEFYFMPYALDGTIDFYGRFNTIHPVPMTSGADEEKKKSIGAQAAYLEKLKLTCRYGIILPDKLDYKTLTESAVLLHDYTKQLPQTIIPRQQVNDAIIDIESDILPYMNTSLLAGSGIKGMRVSDEDQENSVNDAARSLKLNALSGKPWIPITAEVEMQELSDGSTMKSQDYLMALQSVDNLRLSSYGLDNGGLFEKKAHVLESEQEMNSSTVSLIYQDGLTIRQNFCNIVNSIWDLGIWCDVSEDVLGLDRDGDGFAMDDNQDASNSSTDTGGSEDDTNV